MDYSGENIAVGKQKIKTAVTAIFYYFLFLAAIALRL